MHPSETYGFVYFCRQVYQELARLGSMEQQALLNKQLDELEAPMSLCRSVTSCCACMPSQDAMHCSTMPQKCIDNADLG